MLGDRLHNFADYPEVKTEDHEIPERTATNILREFIPEDIAEAYRQIIENPDLPKTLDHIPNLPPDGKKRWVALQSRYPSIHRITNIIDEPYERFLIQKYAERFRRLINSPGMSVDDLIDKVAFFNMPANALSELIALSFTPTSERSLDALTKGSIDLSRIVVETPDFTQSASSPSDQLGTVIKMLSKTNNGTFTPDSYYGILVDIADGGKGSALRPQSERNDVKQTDLDICPAAPFVRRFFEGVGMALSQNHDRVLSLIS